MMKVGASFADKKRIADFVRKGVDDPEVLSQETSVPVDKVKAIIKQAKAGTLKLAPNNAAPFKNFEKDVADAKLTGGDGGVPAGDG